MPPRAQPEGTVRVWGEVCVTVSVTDNPPQFAKVTIGHERTAQANETDIRRVEKQIYELNEELVAARVEQVIRTVRQTEAAVVESPHQRRRRRAAS